MAPMNSRPVVIQSQPRQMMPQLARPIAPLVHPAPLPEISQIGNNNPHLKKSPPKPKLKISKLKTGKALFNIY